MIKGHVSDTNRCDAMIGPYASDVSHGGATLSGIIGYTSGCYRSNRDRQHKKLSIVGAVVFADHALTIGLDTSRRAYLDVSSKEYLSTKSYDHLCTYMV